MKFKYIVIVFIILWVALIIKFIPNASAATTYNEGPDWTEFIARFGMILAASVFVYEGYKAGKKHELEKEVKKNGSKK